MIALLIGATVVAVRATGGDQRTPLVEIAVTVPFVAPLMLAGVGVALAVRRYRLMVACLALFAVLFAWLLPPLGVGVARPALPAGARPVTVMAFNALTGLADADEIVRLVRDRQVDVLSLEEATPELVGRLRSAGLATDLPYVAGQLDWGGAGLTLWSRWPMTYLGELSTAVFPMPQRRVQLPGGGSFAVTAVHTISPVPGRVQEWRQDLLVLRDAVRRGSGSQVFLGDFNATRDHGAFRALLEGPAALTDAAESVGVAGGAWPGFTWPADQWVPPFMRLDHVLVSPAGVAVRSLDVVQISASDHKALVAVLDVVPS